MELTISARSRCLAFGWEYDRNTDRVEIVNAPQEQGGMATVRRQMRDWNRARSGGVWTSKAFFVGGRRVRAVWTLLTETSAAPKPGFEPVYYGPSFEEDEEPGAYERHYMGWGRPFDMEGEIMWRLSEGEAVDVMVED